jgi:5-methyltetrahydropteroyltriglutamate--homocysteine methyltransferase
MLIEKTVIGSFPKSRSPLEAALREVVELQLRYGVDLITDGEQRANMIQYFDQIPGTEKVGNGLRIAGKIKPVEPDKLHEFYKIKDYGTIQSILRSLGKQAKTKITLTGPMTLGTIVASTDINSTAEHYDLDHEETLFTDFSDALLPLAEKALSVGAYVQIDEPLLSTGQVMLETASKILKDFTSRLPANAVKEEKVSCHVCGSIKSVADLYDVLLGLDIPVLSLGFSGDTERENFDVVSRASLEEHGKKLGAGFISNVIVEEDGVIAERLKRIVEVAGKENIRYLHPDCGFGLTRPERVKLILEKMQKIGALIGSANSLHA